MQATKKTNYRYLSFQTQIYQRKKNYIRL